MLEGINYLHAKFQINILKNRKVIKLLELWQLWLMKKEKNSEYNSEIFTTQKNIKINRKKTMNINNQNKNIYTSLFFILNFFSFSLESAKFLI